VWQPAERAGTVGEPDLTELSGLAASVQHPGLLWAHNDAGNDADVYLLGTDGVLRARWRLQDTGDKDNRDWEDSAVGPCRDGASQSCLWLADIGDNDAKRSAVRILRWAEPLALAAPGAVGKVGQGANGGWQAVSFTYPEGPQDAEALAALPDGRLIVATKRKDGRTRLYRVGAAAALDAGQASTTAELLTTVRLDSEQWQAGDETEVTAASLTADASVFALRSKQALWLWHNTALLTDTSPATAQLASTFNALSLTAPKELQGEALTSDASGDLWTSSEGKNPPLHRMRCQAK